MLISLIKQQTTISRRPTEWTSTRGRRAGRVVRFGGCERGGRANGAWAANRIDDIVYFGIYLYLLCIPLLNFWVSLNGVRALCSAVKVNWEEDGGRENERRKGKKNHRCVAGFNDLQMQQRRSVLNAFRIEIRG